MIFQRAVTQVFSPHLVASRGAVPDVTGRDPHRSAAGDFSASDGTMAEGGSTLVNGPNSTYEMDTLWLLMANSELMVIALW